MKIRSVLLLGILLPILALNSCKKETEGETSPIASFEISANSLEISFTNTSTPSTADFLWNFGDGQTSSSKNPTHAYAASGNYTVSLKASNTRGENTATMQISVTSLEKLIKIETSHGDMIMWLWDDTPLHKDNFLILSESSFFNGTTFHRIIDEFVIQGGDPNSKDNDPTNDGTGGPGYTVAAEFSSSLTHVHGAVGAARLPDNINPNKESNGSQFYIVERSSGTHFLDGNYTVFGQIIDGLSVVSTIATQAKDSNDRPITDINMTVSIIELSLQEIKTLYNFEP